MVRSTDEGWMKDSSSGSMTIRPAASSSLMDRSERITRSQPRSGDGQAGEPGGPEYWLDGTDEVRQLVRAEGGRSPGGRYSRAPIAGVVQRQNISFPS